LAEEDQRIKNEKDVFGERGEFPVSAEEGEEGENELKVRSK